MNKTGSAVFERHLRQAAREYRTPERARLPNVARAQRQDVGNIAGPLSRRSEPAGPGEAGFTDFDADRAYPGLPETQAQPRDRVALGAEFRIRRIGQQWRMTMRPPQNRPDRRVGGRGRFGFSGVRQLLM